MTHQDHGMSKIERNITHNDFVAIYGNCPFVVVNQGYEFSDYNILSITSGEMNDCTQCDKLSSPIVTVAHQTFIQNGSIFNSRRVLLLEDSDGDTVAHYMHALGYEFIDELVLAATNKSGYSVKSGWMNTIVDNGDGFDLEPYYGKTLIQSIRSSKNDLSGLTQTKIED